MSLSRYTDVWCDVCGTWEQEATSRSAGEARRIAQRIGWKVALPGGLDMCPRCAAEGRRPTNELGAPEWAPAA